MSNPVNEIKEYNKLGICMKDFAYSFGMVCVCDKCREEIIKTIEPELSTNS